MLTLVTGKPGAGKTLWAVGELKRQSELGRLCYSDIADLTLPGVLPLEVAIPGSDDPVERARRWSELPDGAFVCLDECQRAFPPRNPMTGVPSWISAFETHRHRGMDFLLVTQGPRLIDRHLHDLIERHVHLYRPFGLRRSVVSEWGGVSLSPDPVQSRDAAQKRFVPQDKSLFRFYRSASLHTDRARVPWRPIVVLVVAVGVVAWASWSFVSGYLGDARAAVADASAALPGDPFEIGRGDLASVRVPVVSCDPVAVFGGSAVVAFGCERAGLGPVKLD